jgi:hypothetical protein
MDEIREMLCRLGLHIGEWYGHQVNPFTHEWIEVRTCDHCHTVSTRTFHKEDDNNEVTEIKPAYF